MKLLCQAPLSIQSSPPIFSFQSGKLYTNTTRFLSLFLLAALISSCCSVTPLYRLNNEYHSDLFELKVADYLSTKNLFTLSIKLPPNEELGVVSTYILMQKENTNTTYCKKLHSSNLLLKNRFKKATTFLIDNNYLFIRDKKPPLIYHRNEYIPFFPSHIGKGRYKLQVVIDNSHTKIYSNIITVEYPLTKNN